INLNVSLGSLVSVYFIITSLILSSLKSKAFNTPHFFIIFRVFKAFGLLIISKRLNPTLSLSTPFSKSKLFIIASLVFLAILGLGNLDINLNALMAIFGSFLILLSILAIPLII